MMPATPKLFSDMNSRECPHNGVWTFSGVCLSHIKNTVVDSDLDMFNINKLWINRWLMLWLINVDRDISVLATTATTSDSPVQGSARWV